MGKFKLVGVDLDGTVLNKDKKISRENIEAFKKCREKGIYIVPVTGRPISGLYEEYISDIGCRYSINTNGAVAVDLLENREIITHTIKTGIAESILDVLENFDCYYSLFYKGLGYLTDEKYNYELNKYIGTPMHRYIRKTRRAVKNQREFLKDVDHCDNIYVTAKNTEIREEICKEIFEFNNIFFTCSDVDDVEIGGDCSKGKTLLELAEALGIDRSSVLAIGDGGNDVAMLEMAGLGVAMGNSSQLVKNSADFVTKDCENNGVAYALHKFCLQDL